ncbi:MAG TPA: DUF3800 domain-containing protein [Solirubrobacterales bacterium]|nr:DUF3800 domain-containing protein [Solirubrobacterales bacterium]
MGLLHRVYVDEAGDRGISKRSGCHFVVSGVVVADPNEGELRDCLRRLRTDLGRGPDDVLHFVKFSHSQRLKAVQDIAASPLATVINVIVHKDLIGQPFPSGNMAHISRPDPMYLWALRLLLERVSWFVDDAGGDAIVTFAHLKGFKAQKLHDYRAALEGNGDTGVRWSVFAGHPFRIESPKSVELLQVADVTASALLRAIEPDAYGNTEMRYVDELRPKLYRRGDGDITSYGLKVFPTAVAEATGPLAFLREL